MQLQEVIYKEHSKANCEKIVQWIGNNHRRFDELMQLFFSDDQLIAQRSAWPLSYIVIKHPALIKKHLSKALKQLQKPNVHTAIKRNILRFLQHIAIPHQHHGSVMQVCFDFISDPQEKAAVKAFSLTVLENLYKTYPDIGDEIKTIIEDRWEYESAAFRSRARKMLKVIMHK